MSFRMLIAVFLLINTSLFANNSFANDTFEVTSNWKFKHGNDLKWKSPSFDDHSWERVEVPKLLFQGHEKPVMGWYRVNFDLVEPVNEKLALLIETIRHADETWLNGTKIGGLGETYNAWDLFHTNPQSLPRLYKIPDYLLKEKNNLLAIKINVGFGEAWGAMFPGGAGITKGKVLIGDHDTLLQKVHAKELKIITIDTVFAVLGLLDLFLIVMFVKTALGVIPEFKWLLVTSFFLLLGASAHDINYVYSINILSTNFSMVTAMLVLPYTTAMYFWSQYKDVNRTIVVGLSFLWGLNVAILLLPGINFSLKNVSWYVWNFQAVLFFIYSIYASIKGLFYRRIGAIAQFLGIMIYAFSIRSQWLPEEFFGHRNIQIGSLFYRYALLFAYFQQIAHIRLDYKNLANRLIGVADEVRYSIARELHDGMGQHLASAKLQTRLAEIGDTKKHFALVQQELESAIVGLRRLINGLHPVAIDKTNIFSALQAESKNLNKIYNVDIAITFDQISLDKKEEVYIFRIFQECVTNAIKHGKANKVMFKLILEKNTIKIEIDDNGKGFNINEKKAFSENSGYGLISLKERVDLLDGSIDIRSKPNKGTLIKIMFPYTPNM